MKAGEDRRSRRKFLKTSGAVVAAVAAPAGAAKAGQESQSLSLSLDLPLLHAFAEAVLPAEIGADGVRDALRDFVTWMNGFEPVAELPHPYLSSVEVQYGPPHPAPRWASQLQALDLLATRQHGSGLADLPVEKRRELIAADLERHDADADLPRPAYAGHIAVGLLARFYSRPRIADLAYGARINAAACRDLASGAVLPPPLATDGAQG
ncbi:MAG: twin-arginine translocation signal domain-containing protein [Acidobacteriota bacterium]|nr:twin-arginine translocation signal domain-containing protein [Acidobacteriota bacterium]MDE2710142.1 twin-arginine translocation signal domain-containing protein [Acidobacteriota bacterium]